MLRKHIQKGKGDHNEKNNQKNDGVGIRCAGFYSLRGEHRDNEIAMRMR